MAGISHTRVTLRQKLLLILLCASTLSSLLAGCALFIFQSLTLRNEFGEQMVVLARVVAPYSAAPIAFADQQGIDRALGVLHSKPELINAAIVSQEGLVLGTIGAPSHQQFPMPPPGDFVYKGWHLCVAEPIQAKNENLGVLYLVADFRPVFQTYLWRFIPTLGVVMALAISVAALGTIFISRLITRRLKNLADTAQQVSTDNNYALRAPQTSLDEIGVLTDSFNTMLERLQHNDSALRASNEALTVEINERERLQAELIQSSRLAGMAEVATGVLHNVGNVLNSVNVSAGLIREQLSNSQLDKLKLSAELILENKNQLDHFFIDDPKGMLLPDFLSDLAAQLRNEHELFAEELQRLCRNIDHIKGIVVLQQNFAKATSVIETLSPTELFEHALLINQAVLARNHAQLHKEFISPAPALQTDRHKVLQILINLISNASYATLPNSEDKRHIRVATSLSLENNMIFTVSDNGCGIAAEHLPRLFSQGFTTRVDGHGFGLHSAALAAKAIGGSIQVDSEGAGKGSCFTVTIPLILSSVAP